jgi:GNAT superfamily N-acetyltransferase
VVEQLRVERLSTQDRSDFDCGVPELNRYLKERASQDMRRRVSNCFLATTDKGAIAGYYTFAASSLPLADLPEAVTKRLPRYPYIPAGLVGRLAVDLRFRERGVGRGLLADAVRRASTAAPAIFMIFVDAKDEGAATFYRHHAFQPLPTNPLRLFLTIATA